MKSIDSFTTYDLLHFITVLYISALSNGQSKRSIIIIIIEK